MPLKHFWLVSVCVVLFGCGFESKNPFASMFSTQRIEFRETDLIGANGPEPMYLKIEYNADRTFKYHAGFPRTGRGMIGFVKCDDVIYRLMHVLSGKVGSKTFFVKSDGFQFDNFGIGWTWLRILFDKPILSGSLPERIYAAGCTRRVIS